MKRILPIVFLLFLVSCAAKLNPLKGDYLTAPYQISSANSKEVVWDKVIDLFAQKGLPIKIIDKSSGLIISEKSALLTTAEDKTGKPINPGAWVVVPSYYNYGTRKNEPAITGDAIGEWNIRVKNDESGKCIVNVNIVNLKQRLLDLRKGYYEGELKSGRSTGVFEKMVADLVK